MSLTQAAAESLCVPAQTEREARGSQGTSPRDLREEIDPTRNQSGRRQGGGGEPRLLRAERREDVTWLATCQLQRDI